MQWNSPIVREWVGRIDHAMIFVLIAGTSTPVCVLALSQASSQIIVPIIWGVAGIGILKSFLLTSLPKWVSALLYVAVGWLITPYFFEFRHNLSEIQSWCIVLGGLIYTVGAAVYAGKWPNPWPLFFGYHEIFHILVVVAATLHFLVIYSLVQ